MKLPRLRLLRHLRRLSAHPLDALGLIAAVTYALPSLLYPFAKDQPIHWYLGIGILRGELPYATGISTKPPGPFAVHALAVLLFGDHQWSIRILDILFVLACAALIATFRPRAALSDGALTRPRYRDGAFGAAAILTSGIHYTFFDWSATAHPELWEAFFMLASAWTVARAPGGRVSARRAFAAGALACAAVTFKHVAALHGVVVGFAATALALRHLGLRRGIAAAASYTGGVAFVLALTLLPFAIAGHLHTFYEVMVEYILKYAGAAPPPPESVPPFFRMDAGGLALLYAAAGLSAGVAVAVRGRGRGERANAALIVACTLAALTTVLIQGRPLASAIFSYQFVVCGPFFALAIAWGLRQASPRARLGPVLLSVALIAFAFWHAPPWVDARPEWSFDREWKSFIAYVGGRQSRAEHLRPYGRANHIDRYDTQELAGLEVRRRAEPGDTLCVEGFATAIYTVAKLRCPSRHFAEVTAYEGLATWMPEHKRVLRETMPTFIVTFPDRRSRIRELEELGYTRHAVEGAPLFVIMEHRDDG